MSVLRAFRQRNNLSQAELAEILKCSTGLVSHIETGKRPITPKKAKDWEPLLGISREKLCPEFFGKRAA